MKKKIELYNKEIIRCFLDNENDPLNKLILNEQDMTDIYEKYPQENKKIFYFNRKKILYDLDTTFPSIGSAITLKNHPLVFLSLSNNPNNKPTQSFVLDKIYFPIPLVFVYNLIKPDFAFIILFPLCHYQDFG